MHIISSIKSHVASVASAASSSAAAAAGSSESSSSITTATSNRTDSTVGKKEQGTTISQSIRGALSSINPKPKYKRQPCPPISIQTTDISWPIGSGDRTSPRSSEYDILSASDFARSPQLEYTRSVESNHRLVAQSPSAAATVNTTRFHVKSTSTSAKEHGDPIFTLSRRRNNTLSRKPVSASDVAAATATTVRAHRTGSVGPADATTPNTSPLYITSVLPAANIRKLRSGYSSPSTASSISSYVEVQPPVSPLSSPTRAYPASAGRVRRGGTITRAGSQQSANSLNMSQTTISTVVSTTSPGVFVVASRPMSSDSIVSTESKGSAGSSKPLAKKEETDDDELRGPPPRDDWDVVLDHIREYRATHEAPVDTVGCEALTEEEKDPKLSRFRSLISLMLSAQTKDEITADAVRTLSQRLTGGLSPKSLSDAPIDTIHECIRRVGFWQRKANYIKEAARTCLEQYDSDIPRTVPQLLSLPGVGPKMAYLAMHAAWQDTQGIGVDTHVLRITHRLGWVSESAKSPEATRHSLESWMPKSLWREINPILVGLGQTVCRAVGPKCGECPVSRHCPSSQAKRGGAAKRGSRGRDADQLSEDTMFGDQSQLGEVDVEDLASMVRGAEQAVRSRKNGAGRQRKQEETVPAIKAEFPEIPSSPSSKLPNRIDGRAMRARARSRASSCLNPGMRSEDEGIRKRTTPAASPYFMRSRSNAASEEVRPEAKTDSVRSARAKVTAKKLYSRRLSKSDMQWALGEDWDPEDDSSSMSSLSDVENALESDEDEQKKPSVSSNRNKEKKP